MTNLSRTLFAAALGGVALALAACGGGGTTVMGPTPGPTCGPANIQSQLIYPKPGATAVPDSLSEIVVAVSSPLPANTFNLALTSQNGSNAQTANPLAQIQASQLPAGSAMATIPTPTYEAVNLIVTLPSATKISLALNIPNDPNNCTPQTIPGASFTTK
ncbi:MAG TPA: hypothetical protein VGN11_05605 [Candidatus Baltobacteraceae bacterium]|nr:hypothetical protein [Candidatus Baltobacteraceae bacterium]